jgi:uncharacterized protein (UPF0276 family)
MNFSAATPMASLIVPPRVGVGLKPAHFQAIIETHPDVGFFAIHAEDYLGAGAPPHHFLEAIRAEYPLSVHCARLAIGSSETLDREHLQHLRRVVARYEPGLVSVGLTWSTRHRSLLDEVLPLPYTRTAIARTCAHVDEVQSTLRQPILIENPAAYMRFVDSALTETGFLSEVAARTGCGLLLDITSPLVSTTNQGASPESYIDAFPIDALDEIRLSGFSVLHADGAGRRLLNDRGSSVHADVWALCRRILSRCRPLPCLIEWDNNIPEWCLLLDEAQRAEIVLRSRTHVDLGA